MKKQRGLKAAMGGVVLAGGILATTLLAAVPAQAACNVSGWFCGYDLESSTPASLIVESSTTANTTVDIADNKLSAAQNQTSKRWCAVNQTGAGNSIIFLFAPSTNYTVMGGATNAADFLWVGTAGGCS